MGKLNMEFLNSAKSASDKKEKISIDNFKNSQDIFLKGETAIDMIDIANIQVRANHPFVIHKERVDDLVASIAEQGMLVPLLIRLIPNTNGEYEILAGHHRYEAAKICGLSSLPCQIKNVSDDEADIIMVETNKQRSFQDMLPSEIARSLYIEYEALKRQGKRSDIYENLNNFLFSQELVNPDDCRAESTSPEIQTKLRTSDKVGQTHGFEKDKVARYIRISTLADSLMNMLDDGIIEFTSAYIVSFVEDKTLQEIIAAVVKDGHKLNIKKAEQLKETYKSGKLDGENIETILRGKTDTETKKITSVKIPVKKIKDYIPVDIDPNGYEEYILAALDFYKQKGGDVI